MNHMLSLADVEQEAFMHLIERSCTFANNPGGAHGLLSGRSVGLEFRRTSTRTRTSFAAAAARLGATPLVFGPNDLQTNTGECLEDSVAVLSSYLDMLILRTAGDPLELRAMAALNVLPIVNAMTADEHPTQALSDLAFIHRRYRRFSGLHLLYVGEGNNTAVALAYAVSRCAGMEIDFRTPQGYGLTTEAISIATELGKRFGGKVRQSHQPPRSADAGCADIVYTTRWQTTGTSKQDRTWREQFMRFRVTAALMECVCANGDAVFMHDLPAVRGEECDTCVLEGPRSVHLAQAQQKLFTAMALMEWCAAA